MVTIYPPNHLTALQCRPSPKMSQEPSEWLCQHRRGCPHSYLWPRSPTSGSIHFQGKHPSWHFRELRVFFPTWQKAISLKYQNKLSRLFFYQISTHVGFHKKLPLTNLWQQGALQGLPSLFRCAWSCQPGRGGMPQCGWENIDLLGGNGHLAGTEELYPHLSSQELSLQRGKSPKQVKVFKLTR